MTVTDRVTIDDLSAEDVSVHVDGVATVDPVVDLSQEAAAVPVPADSAEPEPVVTVTLLDNRLLAVDAKLAELADGIGATGAAVESVRARADAIAETEAGAAARLTETEGQLASTVSAVQGAAQQLEAVVGRLATVDARLDSLGDQLTAVRHQQADHELALTEVARTIAVEVERHTTDALVDTQHSLQLAVNSIAQLSLAMAESSRDLTEDVSAESATALLDSFRVDLDAILGQLGFSSLNTTVGAAFDPHRHRALKRVATSDPARDKVITTVIRDGYLATATGRILLFADVEVSRHRP